MHGLTGHAEVVQITFDPSLVSYREILELFFDIHDPTTLNRQGADVGSQYRSAIFYHDDEAETDRRAAHPRKNCRQGLGRSDRDRASALPGLLQG